MSRVLDHIKTEVELIAFLREHRKSDRHIRKVAGLSARQFKRMTKRSPNGLCPIAQAWHDLMVRYLNHEKKERGES